MTSLFLRIIPLDLAATLSPVILAFAVVILSSKIKPKASILVFILGAVIAAIFYTVLGIVLGNVGGEKPTLTAAVIDIVIGFGFAAFAIYVLVTKEKGVKTKDESPRHHILKWFIIALIINLTNFDADFLLLTAAREVSLASLNILEQIWFWIMNIAFFTLPSFLPLLIYLAAPQRATVVLAKINAVMTKYSKYIMFVLFMVFGVYFLYRGLHFFF